jgi:hypothetical protein
MNSVHPSFLIQDCDDRHGPLLGSDFLLPRISVPWCHGHQGIHHGSSSLIRHGGPVQTPSLHMRACAEQVCSAEQIRCSPGPINAQSSVASPQHWPYRMGSPPKMHILPQRWQGRAGGGGSSSKRENRLDIGMMSSSSWNPGHQGIRDLGSKPASAVDDPQEHQKEKTHEADDTANQCVTHRDRPRSFPGQPVPCAPQDTEHKEDNH